MSKKILFSLSLFMSDASAINFKYMPFGPVGSVGLGNDLYGKQQDFHEYAGRGTDFSFIL
jgi:hypothetical protein